MKIVLLSGGSGQRLWPLSNDNCSKQYIKFINHDPNVADEHLVCDKREKCSMLQRVYEQLSQCGFSNDVVIVASEAQREIVFSQLGDRVCFSAEPMRRDTFPAVLLSSSYIKSQCKANDDDVIACVPVDPYVDMEYFYAIQELGECISSMEVGVIGLLGATPLYPSEKYGYIIGKSKTTGIIDVLGFAEKPTVQRANELIETGAFWNCGVFCFKVGTARRWAEKYNFPFDYDEIAKAPNYISLPKISFDYEVLEQANSIIAICYKGMWKDIGTWNTLTEEMNENQIGNVIADGNRDCHILNTLDVPVVVMGGDNLVVAASRDGILVADKEKSSYIKKCLDKIGNISPRYEERRWGTIKTLDRSAEDGNGIVTNMVKVLPGQSTTYHRHMFHEEIVTIVAGEGVLILNGTEIRLKAGSSITINRGMLHKIAANDTLRYVEILIGRVDSDDIERIDLS